MSTGIGFKLDSIGNTRTDVVGVIKKDAYLVAEALHRLLNTSPFERPMEPFGCRIKEVLFEPNDFISATIGSFYINDAVERYEPRVIVKKISIDVNRKTNTMVINIIFQLRNEFSEFFRFSTIIGK